MTTANLTFALTQNGDTPLMVFLPTTQQLPPSAHISRGNLVTVDIDFNERPDLLTHWHACASILLGPQASRVSILFVAPDTLMPFAAWPSHQSNSLEACIEEALDLFTRRRDDISSLHAEMRQSLEYLIPETKTPLNRQPPDLFRHQLQRTFPQGELPPDTRLPIAELLLLHWQTSCTKAREDHWAHKALEGLLQRLKGTDISLTDLSLPLLQASLTTGEEHPLLFTNFSWPENLPQELTPGQFCDLARTIEAHLRMATVDKKSEAATKLHETYKALLHQLLQRLDPEGLRQQRRPVFADECAALLSAGSYLIQADSSHHLSSMVARLIDATHRHLGSALGALYSSSADPQLPLFRSIPMADTTFASANASWARSLIRLGSLWHNRSYLDTAREILELGMPAMLNQPVAHAGLILALREYLDTDLDSIPGDLTAP